MKLEEMSNIKLLMKVDDGDNQDIFAELYRRLDEGERAKEFAAKGCQDETQQCQYLQENITLQKELEDEKALYQSFVEHHEATMQELEDTKKAINFHKSICRGWFGNSDGWNLTRKEKK